jgi:hypothetical protein
MKPLPRHERLPDLLAASEDKHVRKTRRIEFVGDYNPMADDRILAKLLLSESGRNDLPKPFTPTQCLAIRRSAARAVLRHSHGERLMEHSHQHAMAENPHMGRTYHWHKGNNFICDVDYQDVDALLGGQSGHQFRDITDKDPDEPTVIAPSLEVFKLIAGSVMNVPTMAQRGQGPQRGDIVAAH